MATTTDWRERAAELREIAGDTREYERREKLLALAARLDEVAAAPEAGHRGSQFYGWRD